MRDRYVVIHDNDKSETAVANELYTSNTGAYTSAEYKNSSAHSRYDRITIAFLNLLRDAKAELDSETIKEIKRFIGEEDDEKDDDEIKVGDKVIVVDTNYAYISCPQIVADIIPDKEMIAQYRYGIKPRKDTEYTVKYILMSSRKPMYYIQHTGTLVEETGCYLIDRRGIVKK